MDDTKDLDEERNKLVQGWQAYGAEFGVFVPQQPAPTTWDPDVEEFDSCKTPVSYRLPAS